MLNLDAPFASLPRIPKRFLPLLKKLGLETVDDLLRHLPARYEDYSQVRAAADVIPNEEVTVQGIVRRITVRRSWQRRIPLTEAVIEDPSGVIRAIWFNQPYIKNTLREGVLTNFSGKVIISGERPCLQNPAFEAIRPGIAPTHTARIIPVYPETRGLTSKGLRYLIHLVLHANPNLKDPLPPALLARYHFPELTAALRRIHFPETIEDALHARERFAFEELLLLRLSHMRERAKRAAERAAPIASDLAHIKALIASLPFALTLSQKRSLWEVVQDMEKSQPMNRLLQGDVGSGKTVIAGLSALLAANAGYKAAFMAPTEILARQHFETLTRLFPDFEHGIALLTSSEARISYGPALESAAKKADLVRALTQGAVRIVIGTHALIQKHVSLPNLALVIVDEQHRFGVRQRAELVKRSATTQDTVPTTSDTRYPIRDTNSHVPHFLSMSATPIPRTLSLTLFGNLDLSLITELPKDRKPIITKIVPPEKRSAAYAFIRSEVKKGRQIFVICPRIEPPTNNQSHENYYQTPHISDFETKSVKTEYEKLSQHVFSDLRVAMLHGKLKPKEKEMEMARFRNGTLDILVSTSVVEVGVDVPNATVMMIEGAERFGLAQLYQFRGRVGRGAHQSYCLLFTDSSAASVQTRLGAIEKAKNGMELAELDLKLRGPGEFLGEVQTGVPDIAMKALQHPELIPRAREAAATLLKEDPTLARHPLLKARLALFQALIHSE